MSGIALLAASIFWLLNNKTFFPGWASLLPVSGAVLVIAAGPSSVINRYALGNRLAVFVGLVSYPFYLWHWPFLVFPKITDGLDLQLDVRIFAVAGAFIFAVLTYFFVEKPLRHRGSTITLMLLLVASSIVWCGYQFKTGLILPFHANELTQKIAEATLDRPLSRDDSTAYEVTIDGAKYLELGKGKRTTLFVGDSNMDMYWPSVESSLPANDPNHRALLATRGSCPPILNIRLPINDLLARDHPLCVRMVEDAYALAFANPDIDTIVIAANWNNLGGYHFADASGIYPMEFAPKTEGMQKAMDQLVLSITQLRNQGKRVFLLLNVPWGPEFDPHNLISRSMGNFMVVPHLSGGISVDEYHSRRKHIFTRFADVAQRSGAILLDPVELLCKDGWCNAVNPAGDPVYRDDGHLRREFTRDNAWFIARTLE